MEDLPSLYSGGKWNGGWVGERETNKTHKVKEAGVPVRLTDRLPGSKGKDLRQKNKYLEMILKVSCSSPAICD